MRAVAAGASRSLALAIPNPPGPVQSFGAQAGDGRVSLSWINPQDADFTVVRVLRSTGDFATSPEPNESQTQVYEGPAGSFTDTGLTNGTTYFYTAYAGDDAGNRSERATASSVPRDLTPPVPP